MFVTGITDDPASVLPGDLFCCVERLGPGGPADGHEPAALQAAMAAGAVAVLAEAGRELPADVTESDVPVIYASDTDELAGRLSAVYYGEAGCMRAVHCARTSWWRRSSSESRAACLGPNNALMARRFAAPRALCVVLALRRGTPQCFLSETSRARRAPRTTSGPSSTPPC